MIELRKEAATQSRTRPSEHALPDRCRESERHRVMTLVATDRQRPRDRLPLVALPTRL
jgi:hypothetical protein